VDPHQPADHDDRSSGLLIRSPRLQAELAIPAHLVREVKAAHDDVLTEADRLHRRFGYGKNRFAAARV
jgi:hypothetical protein